MAMVDDTVKTTETGHKTQQMNEFFSEKGAKKGFSLVILNVPQ